MEFFAPDNAHLYIAIVLSVINGLMLCFASYKFFQMIQIVGYKIKGYYLWVRDTKAKYVSRLLMLGLLSAACVLVTNALFWEYEPKGYYSYLGLVFYFYFTIVFIINIYSAPKKIPLKQTARMTRLNIAMGIVMAGVSFGLMSVSMEWIPLLRYGVLCLTPILIPLLVPLVHILMIPIEAAITKKYLMSAKNKLKKRGDLIKIGITGSFGKTSTKYMLNTILSQKYNVCMSPHSFNTTKGISKVVNDFLKPENEILITEMGACNRGDIKAIANFINPKYGIITSVGTQHLYSFGSVENLKNTKYELIEALPSDGIAIFNGFNTGAMELYERCSIEKYAVGKDKDLTVGDIKVGKDGTQFMIKYNKKSMKCETQLLGKHNIENIMLCVRMALLLGLETQQIKEGIAALKPVPHRLEVKNEGNVTILDDSYNASVEGCVVALEVLSKFEGKKIVVTPGLVELGSLEKEENEKFGEKIAKVADSVIVVNKVNLESIKQGLMNVGFNMEQVYDAETLEKAKQLLSGIVVEGAVVLLENDLPDNYL
ncbi:MAG: UDP-N-acetylmuramoyl-tripeptide--D-alanyl-D-alanine ligase [Christensenellaceae bacterium]|nr:UDP-N-acetylmuramoyl-tripeptide--D-alanyl-D-alanine ligase [Christensenellaceae bacterium]